ncbi:MAG: amidohydrolase family protein [Haloferacaceae archaeon]
MATTPTTATDLLEDLAVVDGEVHTGESAPDLIEYVDDDAVREDELQGYAYQPTEKGPYGADGWDRTAGGRIDWEPGAVKQAEDIDDKRAEFGIDRTVFNAGLGFQTYMIPASHKRVLYMRAMNDFMRDRFARGDGTSYASILVVPDHPEESAREIDRLAGEEGFVSAFTNSFMDYGFGHERYEPVLEALERNDVPLVFHGDSTNLPYFPAGTLKSHTFVEHHTLVHPMAHLRHVVQIIGQEIPERYDVTFGFWEAGQSWIQMAMNRMDREYIERPNDAPGLDLLPSDYMREFYYGTQPVEESQSPEQLRLLLETNGLEDQLVFTTDWPHMDFDAPAAIASHEGLTDDQKRKMLQENAERLFGI